MAVGWEVSDTGILDDDGASRIDYPVDPGRYVISVDVDYAVEPITITADSR